MHEADDVIGGPTHDRIAGVRLVPALAHRLVDVQGGVEEVHLGPRQHDLAQLPVADVEHVLHDPAFLGPEELVGDDDAAQLLGGDDASAGGGVAAQQADDEVGGT